MKTIVVFNDKQFYNARHLHNHLMKNYLIIKEVTYEQVQSAVNKRLKTIANFFRIEFTQVSQSQKKSLQRYMAISEGYEEMISIVVNNFDDFIIQYLALKPMKSMMTFRNSKKQIVLAWKGNMLKALAKRYRPLYHETHFNNVKDNSELKSDGFNYYIMNPSSIKQNIF